MDLVTTLKSQHQAVSRVLEAIQQGLERHDAAVITQQLTVLKPSLMAHLDLESRTLYPTLMSAARAPEYEHLADTARAFTDNMVRINAALSDFFVRHSGPELDLEAFKQDFASISSLLGSRIFAASTTLYPLYFALEQQGLNAQAV